MSLPFCYMTFVIMNYIENNDILSTDHVFDLVPFNYIFNRKTVFLDAEFVKNDY